MQKLGRFFRIQGVCRMWVCQNGTRAVSFLSSVCVHVYVRVCVCGGSSKGDHRGRGGLSGWKGKPEGDFCLKGSPLPQSPVQNVTFLSDPLME